MKVPFIAPDGPVHVPPALGVPANCPKSWNDGALEQRVMVLFAPAFGAVLTFTVTVADAGSHGA
jgi:hypothetical protein